MLSVSLNTFNSEVLESPLPVLVDFWAPWCGPCRMLAPILEQLDTHTGDQLKIVKVNADEEPDLTTKYGVIALPTLMLFKNGASIAVQHGAVPLATLVRIFEPHYE